MSIHYITVEEYVEHIKRGEIPNTSPFRPDNSPFSPASGYLSSPRSECTRRGMWAMVDLFWTGILAEWIGERKVLEIMAGMGWLAKAFDYHGVDITATDDYSWDGKPTHQSATRVYPVINMDAVSAIKHYHDAEILVVSWPPYESNDIIEAARWWGIERPIIYIGEGEYGCNAPPAFHEKFERIDHPEIPMAHWDGLHDRVEIGYWAGHVYKEDTDAKTYR